MGLVHDREMRNLPKQAHWISYGKQRIAKKKNFLCFFSGPTGSGKSWSSLSTAEQFDPNFNINNVVFGGLELMELINGDTLSAGSSIVFEEVGVEMSNRNWQSQSNKLLNYLLQTFRHRRFILIMNSPYMDFVDAATRKLFHAEFMTQSIDTKRNICRVKPQQIQYNARMKKFYHKRLTVLTSMGMRKVDFWDIPKPSDELISAYEQKKRVYTDKLNKLIQAQLQMKENNENRKKRETFPHKCNDCGNVWEAKSKAPSKCSRCYKSNIKPIEKHRNMQYSPSSVAFST